MSKNSKNSANSVPRFYLAIVAATMLSAVLGSIHAFSVFIPQWENRVGSSRANISLIYSIALVSLTLAVLFGYRLYGKIRPPSLFLLVGLLGSAGLFLSSTSTSLFILYLAYGVLFGSANGLGYGYALQLSGQALPTNRGLAMGLVTAFYAVGATITPKLFVVLIDKGGNTLALQMMSVLVLATSITAAALLKRSCVQFSSEVVTLSKPLSIAKVRTRAQLWLAYGCAVTAGLMVISHAYGIAIWANLNASAAAWAVTVVAFGNMLGGFSIGFYVDRLSSQLLLRWLPVLSTVGLVIMLLWSNQSSYLVYVALALIGYGYGAIIAVYPVAVADVFGAIASPRIYGQVFTAWGLAGLVGPWVSGWLFDITHAYSIALIFAIVLSSVSVMVVHTIVIDY